MPIVFAARLPSIKAPHSALPGLEHQSLGGRDHPCALRSLHAWRAAIVTFVAHPRAPTPPALHVAALLLPSRNIGSASSARGPKRNRIESHFHAINGSFALRVSAESARNGWDTTARPWPCRGHAMPLLA